MDYAQAMPWQEAAEPAPTVPLEADYSDRDDQLSRAGKAAGPPFHAPMGTWFDPAIDLRDPEGDRITITVLELIADIEKRVRKRRQIDELNHYQIVRKILANGFRCHFHRRPHLVSYSRKADGYAGDLEWLSGRAMARTVDQMEAAGLLDARLGEWGDVSSTYHIKPRLYGIAQACGVGDLSITLRLPPERLVRLREGNSDTPLIAFGPTAETLRWTAFLEAYNVFLAQQDIGLAVTEEEVEWVRDWNGEERKKWGKGRPILYRPELFRTDLYRQFNNGSFELGGRLYGGWWINIPKELRPKITINGQPTVEWDYSGCAVRMLYHERGINYQDDPYILEALAVHEMEAGLGTDHYRKGVKALMQALLNGDSEGRPEMALIEGFTFKPAFNRPQVRRMIEQKHAPIADAFGTGAGLRLQRKDSDLALAIITQLREQGVVALPIHDSFIVRAGDKDELVNSMKSNYKYMLNFNPVIKQSRSI